MLKKVFKVPFYGFFIWLTLTTKTTLACQACIDSGRGPIDDLLIRLAEDVAFYMLRGGPIIMLFFLFFCIHLLSNIGIPLISLRLATRVAAFFVNSVVLLFPLCLIISMLGMNRPSPFLIISANAPFIFVTLLLAMIPLKSTEDIQLKQISVGNVGIGIFGIATILSLGLLYL